MRKIEQEMIRAIQQRKAWKKDNTEVMPFNNRIDVFLHGNHIAHVQNGRVYANLATFYRWPTRTTCSRLRALGFPCRGGNDPFLMGNEVPFLG